MEKLFKVLSDFSRIRILNMLIRHKWCVSEMSAILNLSNTSVSRHLSKMHLVGIATKKQDAQKVYYKLNHEFYDENKLFVEYIKEVAVKDEALVEDSKRMDRYEESGLTCKALCCNPDKAQDILGGL